MIGVQAYNYDHPVASRYSFLRGMVIVLEGNVGVGKSTAGIHLARYLRDLGLPARYIPEHVNPHLLGAFIEDMKRFAFTFQITMLELRRASYHLAEAYAKNGEIVILDRMVHGDLVFGRYQRDLGNITEEQYRAYLQNVKDLDFPSPSLVIYLRATPEKALERVNRRARDKESAYQLSYLRGIHDLYEEMIQAYPHSVLELDYNKDILVDEMEENVRRILEEAITFLVSRA